MPARGLKGTASQPPAAEELCGTEREIAQTHNGHRYAEGPREETGGKVESAQGKARTAENIATLKPTPCVLSDNWAIASVCSRLKTVRYAAPPEELQRRVCVQHVEAANRILDDAEAEQK